MGIFWTLLVIVGIFALIVYAFAYQSSKREESAKNVEKLQRMASATNQYLNKIQSVKTASAKLNNCDKAIETMQQASAYNECKKVFTNYDRMLNKLYSLKKVIPIDDYIKKADKHAFKGNDKSEKNSLLDALYEIESNNVSNTDFDVVDATHDKTGKPITIEYIESRLQGLGWERN